MSEHPLTWLDVFTSTPLTGNQLAVVHDADGIGDETMGRFARETALSETTFVQSPAAAGADYRNRIWTTRGEIPFAGHPTCGTAVAEALRRGEREASFVQQTPSGLQPVDVEITGPRSARVSTLVGPATFGDELGDLDPGLAPDRDPALPIQLVGTGVPQILVPVRSLDHPWPPFALLEELLGAHDALTLYWVVVDGTSARTRSFGVDPQSVDEDAATGSSAAPLMAYLHERTGIDRLSVDQGVQMGRPSRLECAMEGDRIRLGGDAVVVMTGVVDI